MKSAFVAAAWLAILFVGTTAHAQGVYIDRSTVNDENAQRAAARRATVTAAQGEVDRAQAAVETSLARIRANWKANPDLLAAQRDMAIKQAAYDKARQPLLSHLMQDTEYRLAVEQARAADAAVKQEQAAHPTTSPTTLPTPSDAQVQAATEKLQQKSTLRDMEDKAISADPAASAAKADLDAARERVKVLQLQFDAAVLNDPEHKTAIDQLQAARSRLTAASGQY